MKNEELYNKTVGILADAYNGGTLFLGDCHSCAVGNLVAKNCGYEVVGRDKWNYDSPRWGNLVLCYSGQENDKAHAQVASTGYSVVELQDIESAFELREIQFLPSEITGDELYDGAMAVLDMLEKIHKINDCKITTKSKLKFIKK